jgi:tRNA-Thr(GGU) m(6)t(6)A37 methyltransferase TsaA
MYDVVPVGFVRSALVDREAAPKQGSEGAPNAQLVFEAKYAGALSDLRQGDEILVLTWLHRGDRSATRVHPRDDPSAPLRGVFSTRSQDRPNPIGIHRVRVVEIADSLHVNVSDLEAFDGTPVIDIKPVLDRARDR